ncbi:carboxymuconolactone decarboxylase family protein [Streptomyces sp. NPDC091371]|uniref:carboxymuconolactone decarboxylase family protein n=1 Tax=Streptomyces sp. NPDC091371 TaxID=3155303 RepID=UPI0034292E81
MNQQSARRERGEVIFKEVFGREPRPGSYPEFLQITVDHLFGEIWARPQLSLKERELVALTAVAMARTDWELRGHIGASLNLGMSREKIVEVIIQLAYYGGWPVANNGLRVAQEVFAELDNVTGKDADHDR